MKNDHYPQEEKDLILRMSSQAESHPYPLIFASVHGSRLYGFDTPQSDRDVKGCHILPLDMIIGLEETNPRVEIREDGIPPISLVTHDARKYFNLLLNHNAQILEEIFSPITVRTTEAHKELRQIAQTHLTRRHSAHHLATARKLMLDRIERTDAPDIKFALHMYRCLLSGLHLMKTGEMEAHLPTLNTQAKLAHAQELLARRQGDPGDRYLSRQEVELCWKEHNRLVGEIQHTLKHSPLPEQQPGPERLNDLLVRIRKSGLPT